MLPALAPLVPTLIGTAATAVAGVGLTAAAPSIKATLFGKVSRRFNDEWTGDPNTRVIETDAKGNKTFKPLTTEILSDLGYPGGWAQYEASLKERRSRKEKESATSDLKGARDRAEGREDIRLRAQLSQFQETADLNRAQYELARLNSSNQAAATARSLDNQADATRQSTAVQHRGLDLKEKEQTTLADQAERANERARVKDNNEAKLLNYRIGQDKADARYKDAMAVYEQEERRRSIPGALLSRAGLALLGGPNF
jgi:hypothetical protein